MLDDQQYIRLGLYEKALPDTLSWQEKLDEAKQAGFDFVEISVDESDARRQRLEWEDNEIYALRHLCEQQGMPLQSLCLSAHRKFPFGSADEATRRQAHQLMAQAITLAYKLGIRTIQLAGYDVYYEPHTELSHQHFIAGMQESTRMAERAGVMLAVEIMDTNYLNSLRKFITLKEQIPSPWFMAYPDVGNINAWGYDVCDELMAARDYLVQIHLKDTLKVTDSFPGLFRDLVIGEGQVPFTPIFHTLKALSYRAPLVIEMWAKDECWRENIQLARAYIARAAEGAGLALRTSIDAS